MVKVLITGGFGSVGLQTITELLQKEHSVRILDLKNPKSSKHASDFSNTTEIVWGQITDAELVQSALKDVDVVIHLAAILPPHSEKENMADLVRKVNYEGTETIIKAIKAIKANSNKIVKFIFPSAVEVYGPRDPNKDILPITTNLPIIGTDNFTKTKVDCEKLIQKELDNDSYLIARFGIILPRVVDPTHEETIKYLFSISPNTRMPFLHFEDAAFALATAVDKNNAYGKILNISGGEGCRITYKTFVDSILETNGLGTFPEEYFGNDKDFYNDWMDTSEGQKLLNYQRKTFFDWVAEYKNEVGPIKSFLVTLIRPIARRITLKHSEKYQNMKKKDKDAKSDRSRSSSEVLSEETPKDEKEKEKEKDGQKLDTVKEVETEKQLPHEAAKLETPKAAEPPKLEVPEVQKEVIKVEIVSAVPIKEPEVVPKETETNTSS